MFDPGKNGIRVDDQLVARVASSVVVSHVWVNLIVTRDPFTCVRLEESPTSSARLMSIVFVHKCRI